MLPSLDFYTGTVNTSIPANSSAFYQIPVPPEGTRMKWTSTHASTVQGIVPASSGIAQHYYKQRSQRGLQSDTVRNRVAVAAEPDLLPADREPCGDRRDGDIDDERQERADGGRGCFIGLPDAWELRYFGTTIYGPTQDNDRDGAKTRRAMMATASSLRCAREASGPFDKPFRQAPADGLSLSNGKAPSLPRGSGPSGCRHTRSTARSISRSKFVRRKNAGLTYTVLFANTPHAASFQPAVNAPSVTPIGANWERVVVDDSVTIGDQAIRIGRVRVTSP